MLRTKIMFNLLCLDQSSWLPILPPPFLPSVSISERMDAICTSHSESHFPKSTLTGASQQNVGQRKRDGRRARQIHFP